MSADVIEEVMWKCAKVGYNDDESRDNDSCNNNISLYIKKKDDIAKICTRVEENSAHNESIYLLEDKCMKLMWKK